MLLKRERVISWVDTPPLHVHHYFTYTGRIQKHLSDITLDTSKLVPKHFNITYRTGKPDFKEVTYRTGTQTSKSHTTEVRQTSKSRPLFKVTLNTRVTCRVKTTLIFQRTSGPVISKVLMLLTSAPTPVPLPLHSMRYSFCTLFSHSVHNTTNKFFFSNSSLLYNGALFLHSLNLFSAYSLFFHPIRIKRKWFFLTNE